jgi:hypothetical protein
MRSAPGIADVHASGGSIRQKDVAHLSLANGRPAVAIDAVA